ncbi:MAG: hypothetical protein ACTH87_04615 [Enterococcus italicus]
MRIKKTMILAIAIGILSPTILSPVTAIKATSNNDQYQNSSTNNSYDDNDVTVSFSTDQKEFLNKLSLIYEYFYFDENKNIKLELSHEELEHNYQFSNEDLKIIDTILEAPSLEKEINNGEKEVISPMMSVHSGKIWFEYSDVVGTLSSAAMIGPAAVYATIVGREQYHLGQLERQ